MEVHCIQCNNSTKADSKNDVIVFVCPQCQTHYEKNAAGELKKKETGNKSLPYPTISIGSAGTIYGERYTVTGIMIKKAYGNYYWAEYNLEDSKGNYSYLSEASGHWIFLKEIEAQYDVDNHPRLLTHENRTLNLFDYTNTQIYRAKGFFDIEIPKSDIHVTEYILPPHVISIEKYKGTQTTYVGQHIPAKIISEAFPNFTLPLKSGTGLVQPFKIDVSNMAIIFCAIAILMLVSHYFIYRNQSEQHILSRDFAFEEFDGKNYVSGSFTLEGGSAPLTIRVHSGVDNSWANLQIGLVNEQNNEEIYASKDVEFYHGHTDGESWSEGSASDRFNICGVNAGRYHLVLTPQKAPEDSTNKIISVNVVWNQPSMRNVWFMIIALAILAAAAYAWRRHFEQSRWAESNFSPYQ